MNKLVLFDCDETLWQSAAQDYISSCKSTFSLVNRDQIIRDADGTSFSLRPGLRQAFDFLHARNYIIGIVSDNNFETVDQGLRLFGLRKFVTASAINIRLWKGDCLKDEMVQEILSRPEMSNIRPSNVHWFDDKDYSKKAKDIGVNFVNVSPNFDMFKFVHSKL